MTIKMVRPRSITIENLNSLLDDEDYVVLSREDDPNYCTIEFYECGHRKLKTISSITNPLKRNSYCTVCFDNNLGRILRDKGFSLLSKLKYGDSKFSSEYRLCVCDKCGNFVFVLPSSVYHYGDINCPICEYNYYKKIALERGYNLINRLDKYYLLLKCNCGHEFKYQGSNLRRVTPRCPVCGKKDNGSYVYAFFVENSIGSFIKIGKSNNPYLRHLRFSENDLNSYTFISSKHFDTEIDAYRYEKELFSKYSCFRLSPEFSKLFMDSGFTEMFSIDILNSIRKEFENQ